MCSKRVLHAVPIWGLTKYKTKTVLKVAFADWGKPLLAVLKNVYDVLLEVLQTRLTHEDAKSVVLEHMGHMVTIRKTILFVYRVV